MRKFIIVVLLGLIIFGPAAPGLSSQRGLAREKLPRLRLHNKEKNELRRILFRFIDELIGDGNFVGAIEKYMRFRPYSVDEAKAIDLLAARGIYNSKQWAELVEAHTRTKSTSRAFAAELQSDGMATLLWVRTVSLPKSDFCVHYYEADSSIDEERERILKAHGRTEADYHGLDLLNRLDREFLELVNSEVHKFIQRETDARILRANIAFMKSRLKIGKFRIGSILAYAVFFPPIYAAVFVRENGRFQMIAFGDVADSC